MEKKDYHALFRINQLETEGGKCEGGDMMFRNVHIVPTLS